jgi:hypothetical protein
MADKLIKILNGALIEVSKDFALANHNHDSAYDWNGAANAVMSTHQQSVNHISDAYLGIKPRGLYVRYSTDAQLLIDCAEIWIESIKKTGLSGVQLDISTTGAGGREAADAEAASTWYYIWLLCQNNGTTAAFCSKTASPALPTNYTKKRLVAMWFNDSSSNLVKANQKGGVFNYWDQGDAALFAGQSSSWANVSIAAKVPPNVCLAKLMGFTVSDPSVLPNTILAQISAKNCHGSGGAESDRGWRIGQENMGSVIASTQVLCANEVDLALVDPSFDYRIQANSNNKGALYVWVWGFEIEI